jgi:uncharacterized protein (TIGR02145 family)
MKRNTLQLLVRSTILSSILSFVFFVLSCQRFERNDIHTIGDIVFLCDDNSAATKTELFGINTIWIANSDKVGIYSPEARSTSGGAAGVVNSVFTAQSSEANAVFSGSMYWGVGDHRFYSYYPYSAGSPAYTSVPISLPSSQTQINGNNSSHVGSLDFMVSTPVTSIIPETAGTLAQIPLHYNHLFVLVEFQIIRSTGSGTITKLKLKGNSTLAFTGGTINISQTTPIAGSPYSISGITGASNEVIVSLTNAITPTSNYTTTPKIYMIIYPGSQSGNMTISVESGGTYKQITKAGINFLRGRKYIVQFDADQAVVDPWAGLSPVNINGVTWAPRNAGYDATHLYGLLYQWHRKYGQDYSSKTLSAGPVEFSSGSDVVNKDIFFTNNSSPNAWSTLQQIVWNSSSLYNPCPDGWQVPSSSEFNSLISSGNTWVSSGVDGLPGRWFGPDHNGLRTNSIFIPASGFIDYNGTYMNRGIDGVYWSRDTLTLTGRALVLSSSYAVVGRDKFSYGYSVRCKQIVPNTAIINTAAITSVTHNSAICGGNIENTGSSGVTERGVVYGTAENPTTANAKNIVGSGIGNFSTTITGLNSNTTYFVRAYAINGSGTSYGPQNSFTTDVDWGGLSPVTLNGIIWAPRNSGYDGTHKHGLLYQWHRKFGQDYISSGTSAGQVSLDVGNNVNNAETFYIYGSGTSDWCLTQQASWNMSTANPCPYGWRVPTNVELTTLNNIGSTWVVSGIDGLPGRWFGGNHSTDHVGSVFFPASGSRADYNGGPLVRDSYGRYWSSIVLGTNAYLLQFSSSTSYITDSFRAHGFSVRCVKQ